MSGQYNSVEIDSQGVIWIATAYSIYSFDDRETTVKKIEIIPQELTITSNYPNPFNPYTTIEFILPARNFVKLTIYSITGQKIRTLLSESMAAGIHAVRWDGRDNFGQAVSSGVYIAGLRTESGIVTHRVMLLR